MPFAVSFLPTDASPPPAIIEAEIRSAVEAASGPIGAGGAVHPAKRPAFVLDRDQIELRSLSPSICRAVFDAARRTNSVIITGGRGGPLLMMKGSSGKLPDDEVAPAITPSVVPDAAALCADLRPRLRHWKADIARDQRDGLLDSSERPIAPPPDPGSETRIDADSSGVAAKCDQIIGKELSELGWKLQRKIVTRSPKWGVVWRADTVTTAPDSLFRETCWSRTGRLSGISTATQPLEMFDPKASLQPLPAQ